MAVVEFPFLEICNNRLDLHLASNALGVVHKETEWTKIALTHTHEYHGVPQSSLVDFNRGFKIVYILTHPSAESKSEQYQSQKKLRKLAKSHLPVLGVPASGHQEDVLDIDGLPSSKKKDKWWSPRV